MFGKFPGYILASLFALLLVPPTASAQLAVCDPVSVVMTESENREVILSLATALRERFAFLERGMTAALEIEAMEQRGDHRETSAARSGLSRKDRPTSGAASVIVRRVAKGRVAQSRSNSSGSRSARTRRARPASVMNPD